MTSPRTARRLSRILAMLPWVIANPGTTVDEVCRRFDYTPADLAKDLEAGVRPKICWLPYDWSLNGAGP